MNITWTIKPKTIYKDALSFQSYIREIFLLPLRSLSLYEYRGAIYRCRVNKPGRYGKRP